MTSYSYTAKDTNGDPIQGTVQAGSLSDARDEVVKLGLEPIEIYESPSSPPPTPTPVASFESSLPESEMTFSSERVYFPLLETLRLYSGWLLAWYCLVYAIGSYQFIKDMPFHVPYAESLFLSPLVLSFTFAAYLFLLLSGFYVRLGRKKSTGAVLGIIGIALFVLYRMNVE